MKIKEYGLYLLVFMLNSCICSFWGSQDLGDEFALLEGDKIEDNAIVYCTGKSYGCCESGLYILPTYKNHYDSTGNYAEYVETVKSNKKWIVAKSIRVKNKQERYWFINKQLNIYLQNCEHKNCDSIIQEYVIGPFDKTEFNKKELELKSTLILE